MVCMKSVLNLCDTGLVEPVLCNIGRQTLVIMAPPYTNAQRTFIVETYLQTRRPSEVQRRFAAQFPQANRIPSKQAITKMVRKFHDHGTIRNRQSEASGRRLTGRSQA